MNTLNNTEKLLFLNKQNQCLLMRLDDFIPYCQATNAMCDYEFCPILKKCASFEEFFDIIEIQEKYRLLTINLH